MAAQPKKPLTAKKQEKYARNRRNARRGISVPTILSILLVAGLVVLFAVIIINQGGVSSGAVDGVRSFANLDRGHTTSAVTYAQTPPVGGKHNPAWQNCGVYAEPIPNENGVHSLEHGVIWITYQPDLPADQLAQLETLTRQSAYRLLSPYPGLPSKIVASAWGYQIQLEQADDPRLEKFIRAYEQNPQGPEPGAPCTGGVGNPG